MAATSSRFDRRSLEEENQGQDVLIALHLCTIIILLTGGARVAVKIIYRIRFRIADYLIFFALAVNMTANITEYRMVAIGFGRHAQFLSDDVKSEMKMLGQIGVFLAFVANWAIKSSISFFLLGLIHDTHPHWSRVIQVLLVLVFVIFAANAIIWGLQAHPIEKLWKPNIPGTIAPKHMLVDSIYAFAALNVITDMLYALSPIHFFGKLQMDRRKKLLLLTLTGSGLLVVGVSIVRCFYLTAFFDPDFSWGLPRLYIFSLTERNLAEALADLPAIYPVIRDFAGAAGKLLSRSTRSGRTRAQGQSTDAELAGSGGLYPATVGSDDSHGGIKPGPFGAYGYRTHFSTAEPEEDEIYLRETGSSTRAVSA